MTMKNSKSFLLILTAVFFCLLLVLNLALFNFVSPFASGAAFWILQITAVIAVLILSFVASSHYRLLNKVNGGGDKNFEFYFKRIWITLILMFLISLAISEAVGIFANAIVGGMRTKIENSFLQGAVLKIPLFLLYLAATYNMFSQQGYKNADRKVFNTHINILIVAFAFILMMPGAVQASMHNTQEVVNMGGANLHAALSANIDVYIADPVTDDIIVNPNFNIFLTAFTVLLTFAIETAVAIFAYMRGKQTFLKKRLNPAEYETDEKC